MGTTFRQVIINPIALRKAKIVYNYDLSECNRVKSFPIFRDVIKIKLIILL